MSDKMALKTAIDLLHVPSQARLHRAGPLPDGVLVLLRIAAGDDEAESTAAALSDRSLDVVRQAATFFIEQILFASNADSYRVLGATQQANASELRRNVALLMRWLHPDLDPRGERSVFIGRVTAAWNDLKTPERRAAYDDQLRSSEQKSRSKLRNGKSRSGPGGAGERGSNGRPRVNPRPRKEKFAQTTDRIGFFRRALSILLNRPLQ